MSNPLQKTNPSILINEISDIYSQTNFKNLSDYFQNQNQLLGFRFFEIVFTSAQTNYTQAHGLGVIPQDIIVTKITGGGTVQFNHGLFTSTNLSITTTGPCRVRFFAGTYWNFSSSAQSTASDATSYYSSQQSVLSAAGVSTTVIRAPNYVVFLASGTYFCSYYFTITSGNATAGTTYSNNGKTFTVVNTVSGATSILCSSNGAPATSGILTRVNGAGDVFLNFSAATPPLYLEVEVIAAGGGGAGSAVGIGNGSGGNGNPSSFGSLITCVGGAGGGGGGAGNGGSGGTASLSASVFGVTCFGASGQGSYQSATAGTYIMGGSGGASPFSGAGGGGQANGNTNVSAVANSGSGAGSAGGPSAGLSGGGGGSGGYAKAMIPISLVTGSVLVTIGAGGSSGSAGSSGFVGGVGGSGRVNIKEFWQ